MKTHVMIVNWLLHGGKLNISRIHNLSHLIWVVIFADESCEVFLLVLMWVRDATLAIVPENKSTEMRIVARTSFVAFEYRVDEIVE